MDRSNMDTPQEAAGVGQAGRQFLYVLRSIPKIWVPSPALQSEKKLDKNGVCETVAMFSNSAMRMRVLTHPAYTHRLIVARSQYVHHS
jgi:hypothetical protein